MPLRVFDREYSVPKQFFDGTHRSRSPADTLAAFAGLMQRMQITRVANVTGLDHIGIPVFTAFRPNARSLATAQGKGIHPDSARVSALMEASETWHAENIDAPVRWESYDRLRATRPVIDVDELPRVRPVDRSVSRAWLEGWDLMSQGSMWVPMDAVSLDFVGPGAELVRSSNGLASGNNLLEAIVHGLCELIERHAQSHWYRNDEVRLVDLDALPDAYCAELVKRIRAAGVFVAAWDLPNELGIPSFGAVVLNTPEQNLWRIEGLHYGFGTHLEPAIALSRALSEAAQTRLAYIAASRDDLLRQDYAHASNPDMLRGAYEELNARRPVLRLQDIASLATLSFEGDAEVLLSVLRDHGFDQAVVVDLTKPDIGIPVARVIVPGLELDEASVPLDRVRGEAQP